MAKRFYKRSAQSEKHNAGCMWALISLFDFRQGPPTPKLLSDRKHGSPKQGNGYSKIKVGMHSSYEGKYKDANNVMETKAKGVDLCLASVKVLMEEEMLRDHQEKNILISGDGTHSKNIPRERSKTKTGSASLNDQLSDNFTLTERSSRSFDLVAFLIKLYTHFKGCEEMQVDYDNKIDLCLAMKAVVQKMSDHPDEFDSQLDQKEYFLYKALADFFEAIANQESLDEKHIVNKAVRSREFMDALEILDSNKEVVLKLLEDPNSHFYKQIEDRQKTQVVKVAKMVSENYSEVQQDVRRRKFHDFDNNELFHKQSRYSFFWKKDKPKEAKSLKNCQNLETTNRVVVSKTNPMRTREDIMNTLSFSPESHHKIRHEEEGDRAVSHFSLREIKRRLKHIIGGSRKEGRMISRDGVLHRIPIGYKVSGGRDKLLNNEGVISSMEKSSEVLPVSKGKDSKVNPEEHELNIRSGNSAIKPASPIYKEGKKHLVDMLDIGDQTASLRTAHVSRSLGRLLSIPGYSVLSPRVIPGSEKELVFPSELTGSLPLQQFNQEDATNSLSPPKQILEISSCSSSNQIDEITLLDLKAKLTDNHMQDGLCIGSDLNHEGSAQKNMDTVDVTSKLLTDMLDVSLQPNSYESNVACERCNGDLGMSEVEPHTVTQSGFSPRSSLREKLEAPEGTIGKPGRPSPVSVLEKFIPAEFTSPKFRAVEHSMIPTQDARVNLRTYSEGRQARFKYVETVLQASGLGSIDAERWHLAEKLLESSLLDEVGMACSPHIDDPELLFDCINEALEEIQEKFFKCTPWVSLITSNLKQAPVGQRLIKEVSKRIEMHIPMCLPSTSDQIVTKDWECGSWMDLQFETDNIVVEIWDTALDDLVEETIFDLWLELSADW